MRRGLLLSALLSAGCAQAPAATREPLQINSIGMRMLLILEGDFLMGSSAEEAGRIAELMRKKKITSWYPDSPASEAPPRRTRITRSFYLSAFETTVGDFRKFVQETGYRSEAERDGKGADGKKNGRWTTAPEFNWRDMGYDRGEDFPAVNVTWNDATAFCEWLSAKEGRRYRLPTEAEWEYACRAGSTGRYFWGNDDSQRNEFAWTGANSGGGPHPVGRLAPNPWGLYDILGNAYEYCSDFFAVRPYDPAEAVDPRGPPTGAERVVRSGSWGTDPMHPRCAFRGGAGPAHRNMRDGFRVACDP